VVLAVFLRGAVARVVRREKMKTSAEMRERKKRRLFQAWGGRLVVGIATCGGASGGEAGGGWNGGEREGEKNCRNGGRGAGFWSILDLLFSSLMP